MTCKVCRVCGVEKEIEEFHIHPTGKDGHRNSCRICCSAKQRQRRIDNPERQKLIDKKSYEKNIESKKIYKKLYRENNRDKHRASRAKRKLQKRQATPLWANKFLVDLVYTKARRLEIWLEQEFQVDHIVPVLSEFVCGLHCEANLQILPKRENIVKGNRYWPDMW